MKSAPSKSVDKLLDYVRRGGRLFVSTYCRVTVIDAKALARFEKCGEWLLKESGEGYRLRMGKSSIYLFPGQLQVEN